VLLRAAVDAGFTVILTGDQNLKYQQNLRKIGIGAVVVCGIRNRIEELRPLIPRIVAALDAVRIGEALEVTA
jgi:rRNA-processing protein FCF1